MQLRSYGIHHFNAGVTMSLGACSCNPVGRLPPSHAEFPMDYGAAITYMYIVPLLKTQGRIIQLLVYNFRSSAHDHLCMLSTRQLVISIHTDYSVQYISSPYPSLHPYVNYFGTRKICTMHPASLIPIPKGRPGKGLLRKWFSLQEPCQFLSSPVVPFFVFFFFKLPEKKKNERKKKEYRANKWKCYILICHAVSERE